LNEAQPLDEKRAVEMGDEQLLQQSQLDEEEEEEEDAVEAVNSFETKLLSRYGVWLLVELTPLKDNLNIVSVYYFCVPLHF